MEQRPGGAMRSARADRVAGVLLLVIAVFVVVGLHLPSFLDAIREQPTAVQYLSSPTPFWLVKLMDLGIIVPAAVAVGIGALRRREWARKPVYAILGAYTLIGVSVAGMGITMSLRDDPDASMSTLIGMTLLAVLLGAVTCYVYQPLFRRVSVRSGPSAPGISALAHLEESTA
jgi:cytochrome c biogenesis factor